MGLVTVDCTHLSVKRQLLAGDWCYNLDLYSQLTEFLYIFLANIIQSPFCLTQYFFNSLKKGFTRRRKLN
uniref:Uncharacterized protein n=1 Tax=Planktothrix agardhii TaxID=1160 RepID=A0A1J1JHV6_PLAAG|nr:protein of unknown function [Planktothrix agardhii]